MSKDRQKRFYVHNSLTYFLHTDATRKQIVHILYVIRRLINVKSAAFQQYSGRDQAQQYKIPNRNDEGLGGYVANH
jgi:hypothetical protein